jgi:hypothetical protein
LLPRLSAGGTRHTTQRQCFAADLRCLRGLRSAPPSFHAVSTSSGVVASLVQQQRCAVSAVKAGAAQRATPAGSTGVRSGGQVLDAVSGCCASELAQLRPQGGILRALSLMARDSVCGTALWTAVASPAKIGRCRQTRAVHCIGSCCQRRSTSVLERGTRSAARSLVHRRLYLQQGQLVRTVRW